MATIAKDNKTKRKYIENLFINTFNKLDKTKANTKSYEEMFKSMDDKTFFEFANSIKKREVYPYLDVEAFKREPSLDDIEEGAKVLNIPLFEYVSFYDEGIGEYVTTTEPVPVGEIHLRRVQQMVIKKNNTTVDINQRDSKTGQVSGDSKVVKDSDMENYVMSVFEADSIMKELMGPRSDDMVAKQEMYKRIVRDGYVSLSSLPDDIDNKVAIITLDTYFISAGIKTNLVSDGLMLNYTMKDKNTIDKTTVASQKINK